MTTTRDLTGLTFGSLTVIERSTEYNKWRYSKWRCRCICGEIVISSDSAVTRTTDACGCYRRKRPNKVIASDPEVKPSRLMSWSPNEVHYVTYMHEDKVKFYCEASKDRNGWLSYAGETEDALLFENEKGVARASTAKVEVTCKGCKKFWMKF